MLRGNLLRYVCARAHLRAIMTRKSCAVGMRNATLRNHLNNIPFQRYKIKVLNNLRLEEEFYPETKEDWFRRIPPAKPTVLFGIAEVS